MFAQWADALLRYDVWAKKNLKHQACYIIMEPEVYFNQIKQPRYISLLICITGDRMNRPYQNTLQCSDLIFADIGGRLL